MLRYTRSQVIGFSVTFADLSGVLFNPAGATLCIAWSERGCERQSEIAMSPVDGTWIAQWDSRDADPGHIYWHIFTDDAAIAQDGYLLLDGNAANVGRDRGNYEDYS